MGNTFTIQCNRRVLSEAQKLSRAVLRAIVAEDEIRKMLGYQSPPEKPIACVAPIAGQMRDAAESLREIAARMDAGAEDVDKDPFKGPPEPDTAVLSAAFMAASDAMAATMRLRECAIQQFRHRWAWEFTKNGTVAGVGCAVLTEEKSITDRFGLG